VAQTSRPKHAGRNIRSEERTKLWVRAGGRCEFHGCNKYLLEDELTSVEVSLEEFAHIAGQSIRGPRGVSTVPLSERNKAENLMLLCSECHHKRYDKAQLLQNYTEKRLREDKRLHENRIRTQTNLGPEYATLAIRMVANVRGTSTAISRETIRKAVFGEDRRYPEFLGTSYSVDMDLTGLPAESNAGYWRAGRELIDELFDTQIATAMRNHRLKHRSVFAFARIPLLIHLGARLADKCPTTLYQRHRDRADEWSWPSKASTVMFQCSTVSKSRDKSKVAVVLSVSGRVPASAVSRGFNTYEISPVDVLPDTGVLHSVRDVLSFADEYRKLLRRIEADHRAAPSISLFPAVPIPIAIVCGMARLPGVTPPLRVYDKTDSGYALTLEVKN